MYTTIEIFTLNDLKSDCRVDCIFSEAKRLETLKITIAKSKITQHKKSEDLKFLDIQVPPPRQWCSTCAHTLRLIARTKPPRQKAMPNANLTFLRHQQRVTA